MAVATNVYSGKGFPGNYDVGSLGRPNEETVIVRYFDCVARNLAVASHQVCAIPANALVQVTIYPATGEATNTLALGDATTANSMAAAAALVAGTNVVGKTLHYTAANEVQFTIATGSLVAAKFWVIVRIIGATATAV